MQKKKSRRDFLLNLQSVSGGGEGSSKGEGGEGIQPIDEYAYDSSDEEDVRYKVHIFKYASTRNFTLLIQFSLLNYKNNYYCNELLFKICTHGPYVVNINCIKLFGGNKLLMLIGGLIISLKLCFDIHRWWYAVHLISNYSLFSICEIAETFGFLYGKGVYILNMIFMLLGVKIRKLDSNYQVFPPLLNSANGTV